MTDQLNFYMKELPALIGREFRMLRGYGHARYRIVGDHSVWHSVQGAEKVYFERDGQGQVTFPPGIGPETLCIAVIRLGGYTGPGEAWPTLQNLLTTLPMETSDGIPNRP